MNYRLQRQQPSSADPKQEVQNKTKNTSRIRREASFGKNLANLEKMLVAYEQPRVPPKLQKRLAIKAAERRERAASDQWGPVKVSKHAQNTVNPIRKICDALAVPPNPSKEPIRLNLGDPTIAGNLLPSEATTQALIDTIEGHKYDGYGPSVGAQAAREAVAKHFGIPEAPVTPDDVILASGCSHALEMAIVAIADHGDNILVPRPGFPLYSTLCTPNGIETRQYRLKMDEGGLIDLDHMESLVDANTRAIIVNNPSNPTGVVFPKAHLEEILKLAYKHKIPIIADEIYGDLVYNGAVFHSLASLSPQVPIISCDGIGKRYLVPGWRLGWAIVHDRYSALSGVKKGMVALSQKIVGPCALIQGALPAILENTPESFFDNVKSVIAKNAEIVYDALSRVPGLKPLRPQGAMYAMVGFDTNMYGEETSFTQKLIMEESVYCLPGSAFNLPNWFRLVLTYPEEVTREACARITEYCIRHMKPLSCPILTDGYSKKYRQKSRNSFDEGSEGTQSNTESDEA